MFGSFARRPASRRRNPRGLAVAAPAAAQKEIKIGVIYDYTGPFAAGGSQAGAPGHQDRDRHDQRAGGVEGYKIVPIYADAQSKADVAINEADAAARPGEGRPDHGRVLQRALRADGAEGRRGEEVHVGQRVHRLGVFKDKNLQYVFRPQVHSDQFGEASCTFLNENAKAKLGKEPEGPQGRDHLRGRPLRRRRRRPATRPTCKKLGMQIVLKEGYSATAPDLSSLVTKLRRARAGRDPAHRLQPGHHAVPGARRASRG